MSLFTRAQAGYALTAVERSALRFLKSLWLTVLLATLPILSGLMSALNTNALAIDWQAWSYRLQAAVGTSLALAIQKYFSAQGDGVPLLATSVPLQVMTLDPPQPPASNAPASPSYALPVTSQAHAADTPTLVAPVVVVATTASAQSAT